MALGARSGVKGERSDGVPGRRCAVDDVDDGAVVRPALRSRANRNMSKSKGWTLQSSLLMLWMEKTQVNNQTTIDDK